jgi:hypothetical protein
MTLTLPHPESIAPRAQVLAEAVSLREWSKDFYLAGSAALALHIAHRPVAELDVMSPANRLTGPERRDLLADLVAMDESAQVETARDGYLFMRLGGGTALRFFYYPYPQVDPQSQWRGLQVASAVDLGLMKIAAIISRGSRRDFVDIFCLGQQVPLANLLARSGEKFARVRDFPLQALKGLADISEIEGEPMPRLAKPLAWEEVEVWREATIRELSRSYVGLPGSEPDAPPPSREADA